MKINYTFRVETIRLTKVLFDTLYHLGSIQKSVATSGHISGSGYLSVLKSLGLANGKTQTNRIPLDLMDEIGDIVNKLDGQTDVLINYIPIQKGKFVYEEDYR